MAKKQPDQKQKLSVNVNLDTTPILYTDNIQMTANPDGLVMDVMQRLGPTEQVRIVARLGMSREHAKKFSQELSRLLVVTDGTSQTGKDSN